MEASSSTEFPGRIRKRRYSTARIQPTRIKKVMQSDEEIGRMIASVPVAIGSVMEHFTEKLLETASLAMHSSTSKTLSPQHLYAAIAQTPHFSFLMPLVKNLGGGAIPVLQNLSFPFQHDYSSSILPTITEDIPLKSISSMSATSSFSDDGIAAKRKRGRPRKDVPNKQTIPSKDVPIKTNGFVMNSDAERDRELMPPPPLPARFCQNSVNSISSSVVSSQSTTESQPQKQTDAISA